MNERLELWAEGDASLVPLELADVSIGREETNDVALPSDPTVSRVHAVIVRYSGGWCLRDLGSVNGTFLNGQRLLSEQLLRPGDEIRIGAARIVFRGEPGGSKETLRQTDSIPDLTRREHEVLLALCRPLLGAAGFAQPASNKEIAEELVVGEAAVKFHLGHLYDKFGIPSGEGPRRAWLANEAIRRGAVSRAELRQNPAP
jgi:pSer/pThr/pTyr-binding forkhead associated (FHA) protein